MIMFKNIIQNVIFVFVLCLVTIGYSQIGNNADFLAVDPVYNISLTIGDTEGYAGDIVSIPVVVDSGFTDVAMLELHISYCNDLLHYTGASSEYGLTSDDINDRGDFLTMVWVYSGTSMVVPDGDTLITLNFEIDENATDEQTCILGFIGENNIGDPDENVYELVLNAGTFTVVGYSISGLVSYCETNVLVENTVIDMSGDMQLNVYTNSGGEYQFDNIHGNITINPSKNYEFTENEINGEDLLRLKNILLGFHIPTACELWAAECNGVDSTNGFDLLRLQNYLLGSEVDPPVATWDFNPGEYSYGPILTDLSNQNFTARLIGDVNLSWGTGSTSLAKVASGDSIVFEKHFKDVEAGSIHLPICSNLALSIGMLDWCIKFDTLLFTLDSIDSRFLKRGDYRSSEGQLRIVWVYSGDEESFAADEVICTLVLQPEEEQGVGKISFVGDNHISRGDETPYDLAYGDVEVNLPVSSLFEEGVLPTETTLYPNYPNPFNPTTTISYYLQEASDVEIKIYNIKGQIVKNFRYDHQISGYHEIVWNGKDNSGTKIPTGIYFYELEGEGKYMVKKMIMIK